MSKTFKTRLAPNAGTTLIEVLTASSILIIALLGVGAATLVAGRIVAGARDAEAGALAQELSGILLSIPYTSTGTAPSGLFANTNTSNDSDITDMAGAMDVSGVDPLASRIADHAESELPAGIQAGLTPLSATTPNSTNLIYSRYWTVAPISDPVTAANISGVSIAAIVRYSLDGKSYKHVAVVSTRFDPTMLLQ